MPNFRAAVLRTVLRAVQLFIVRHQTQDVLQVLCAASLRVIASCLISISLWLANIVSPRSLGAITAQ